MDIWHVRNCVCLQPKASVSCDPFLLALASWDLRVTVDERGAFDCLFLGELTNRALSL